MTDTARDEDAVSDPVASGLGVWWRARPGPALLITLVCAPLIGLLLVIAADNVPDRLVMEHLADAVHEGTLDAEPYGVGTIGHRTDQFTECVAVTIGLGDEPGTGTVASAIRAPTLGPCHTSVPKIVGWEEGDGLERSYDYFRYWHGHSTVLRPLIAAVGIAGTRLVVALAIVGSLAAFGRLVAVRTGAAAALAAGVVLVGSTDIVDLPRALPHAVSVVSMFVAGWWLLRTTTATTPLLVTTRRGAIAGSAFVFGDILLNPDAAFIVCVFAVGLAAAGSARPAARQMAAAAAGWVLGYIWMWATKWVLAALVVGISEVRQDIEDQVRLRVDGEHAGLELGVFGGIDRTLREWWGLPLTGLVVVGAVALVGVSVWRRQTSGLPQQWAWRSVVALPALVPPVWFSLMRNHTQVHAFFTYRSWAFALAVVTVALVASPRAGSSRSVEQSAM